MPRWSCSLSDSFAATPAEAKAAMPPIAARPRLTPTATRSPLRRFRGAGSAGTTRVGTDGVGGTGDGVDGVIRGIVNVVSETAAAASCWAHGTAPVGRRLGSGSIIDRTCSAMSSRPSAPAEFVSARTIAGRSERRVGVSPVMA